MNNKDKVKLFITSAILTFMGMLSLQMSFLHTFMDSSFYHTPAMLLLMLILSFGFSAAFVFIKYKWIPALAFLAMLIVTVWFSFDAVIGGLSEVVHSVSKFYCQYYGYDEMYLDISIQKIRAANPQLVCVLIVGLLTYIYSLSLCNRKTAWVPGVLTIVGLAAPVVIEQNPPAMVVIYALAYIMALLVIGMAGKTNVKNAFVLRITAIISCGVVLTLGVILNEVVPEEQYKPRTFFVDLREELGLFIKDVVEKTEKPDLPINPDVPSMLGSGALGHVDELSYAYKPVLEVTMPKTKENVYIKGFVGREYNSSSWSTATVEDKNIFNYMCSLNITQQNMVAEYLKSKKESISHGYYGRMKIDYLDGIHLNDYSPLYPELIEEMCDSSDGTSKNLKPGFWADFYSVSYSEFFLSEEEVYEVVSDSEYRECSELYQKYVYDYYLDVNTPIKDQLVAQWGDYDIETGKDRYELAMDIKNYLDENYTYTMKPGKLPKGKDFVEYFYNETKKGYCTYFASAAVMMFRSAGVPARYVEGYMFSSDNLFPVNTDYSVEFLGSYDYSDSYVKVEVLDSDAHAWVEYYVDGIGWIDMEVTGGNEVMNEDMMEEPEEETTPDEPKTTEPEEETTSGEEKQTTTTPEVPTTTIDLESGTDVVVTKPEREFDWKILRTIGIVFAIIIPIGTIIVVLRYRGQKTILDVKMLYNYKGTDRGRVVIVSEYERFEKLMKYSGFPKKTEWSFEEYGEYLGMKCPYVGREEAHRINGWYDRVQFSNEGLTEAEIEELKSIMDRVRMRIYNSIGVFQKFAFIYFHMN